MMNFEEYLALQDLYANYAAALDDGRVEAWPEFFVEDGVYKLQSRENFEHGYPLATLWFESKGMMKDRVFGVRETLYHEPYFQRHVVSAPRITQLDGGTIHAEASYIVTRTKRGQFPEILSVGKYVDVISKVDGALKFVSRHCLFDNDLIPNSIIYPI
jgi:salicylate 5-hydroxylase small subunit